MNYMRIPCHSPERAPEYVPGKRRHDPGACDEATGVMADC